MEEGAFELGYGGGWVGFVWAEMGWEIRRDEGHPIPIRDPWAGQGRAGAVMRCPPSFSQTQARHELF